MSLELGTGHIDRLGTVDTLRFRCWRCDEVVAVRLQPEQGTFSCPKCETEHGMMVIPKGAMVTDIGRMFSRGDEGVRSDG